MNRALKWFGGVTAEDLPDATLTVGRAIEDYIADLKIRKSPEAAKRAEQAGGKHILPQLGRLEVVKLSTKRLKAWQNNLVAESNNPETVRRSKDTANRVLTILKAALNLSFRDGC